MAIGRLGEMDEATIEKQADAILSGHYAGADLALAPFVSAALQVYWLHMATRIGENALSRGNVANLCPVCASPPVASVVKIGTEHGLRYLHCSLCGTGWHMVRVKCSNCESTNGIAYYGIDDAPESVKAEACETCGSYLKIMYQAKDPYVDPVADDLATLALDILMDKAGVSRSGPNPLLIHA
jgi:FdhE protein